LTSGHEQEIAASLERAEQSLEAARELVAGGFCDIAASRAYYAAFYAASAALLAEGWESGKHSGVIALVHQHLVKTGRLDTEQGKTLNWLFELRSVGDYGVTVHVSQEDANKAVAAAEGFVEAIRLLIGR